MSLFISFSLFGLFMFVAGYFIGDYYGVKETERRWKNAVDRHENYLKEEAERKLMQKLECKK